MKSPGKGFSLLEVIMAIVLSAFVLLAAANLLITFGRFSASPEASLLGTALGPFEEIISYIAQANMVSIRATTAPDPAITTPAAAYPASCSANDSCIEIRVDTNAVQTPTNFADDTVFIYWQDSGATTLLNKMVCTNAGCGAAEVIARNLFNLSFVRARPVMNQINVVLEARVLSGVTNGSIITSREHLETTAIMRAKGASE